MREYFDNKLKVLRLMLILRSEWCWWLDLDQTIDVLGKRESDEFLVVRFASLPALAGNPATAKEPRRRKQQPDRGWYDGAGAQDNRSVAILRPFKNNIEKYLATSGKYLIRMNWNIHIIKRWERQNV